MLRPLTFLFSICFFLAAYAAAQTPASSCPCTLRGTVIDSATGQPIRSALVKATGAASAWSMLSDSEGKFQFESVPAGKISLAARKPGYESPVRSSEITFNFDQNASVPAIKLTPLGVIFGHVQSEHGEPIEGVAVEVLVRSQHNRSGRRNNPVAHTDDLGNYRIANLPGGRSYYLMVRNSPNDDMPQQFLDVNTCYPAVLYPGVPDFSSATALKVLPGQSIRADFTLEAKPMIRLSGTVLSPHSLAEVNASLTGLFTGYESIPIQIDGNTGAFASDWISPGSYVLFGASVAEKPQQKSQYFIGRLEINARTSMSGLRLVLLPTAEVLISIRGVPDSQEPGLHLLAQIHLESRDRDLPSVYPARFLPAESGGKFITNQAKIEAVPPGTYAVRVLIPPGSSHYVESISSGTADLLRSDLVIDASGSAPVIEVSMREGAARLSGKLASASPSGTAYVILWNPSALGDPSIVETDANGSFAFSSLRPATYKFFAVDATAKFDLSDLDSLGKLASGAKEISLSSGQSATADVELMAVTQ